MLRKDRIARLIIGIILGIGIVIGVLWGTGILQSNQSKFQRELSYLKEPIEKLLYSPNENFHRLARLQNYTKEGTATFHLDGYHQLELENKIEDNTEIQIMGRINGSAKQSYTEYRWLYGETEILKVKAIRDDQKIGLQSDEIVNGYLAIENSNLKDLLNNLDQAFPYEIQQIEMNSLVELFKLETVEEQALESYVSYLKEDTKKENYTKVQQTFTLDGEQKQINGYQLKLSKEETKQFFIRLCENLQQDSITLNMISKKMKTIGFSEEAANVNQINSRLEEWKQQLQNNQISVQELTISLYSWKKSCIQCVIQYGNLQISLQQDPTTGKVELTWNTEANTGKIEKVQTEGNKTNLQIQITNTNGEEWTASVEAEEKNTGIKNTLSLYWKDSYGTASVDYTEENTFQQQVDAIEQLTQTNSVTLNQYPKDQLQTLLQAIQAQWDMVYQNKRNALLQLIPE